MKEKEKLKEGCNYHSDCDNCELNRLCKIDSRFNCISPSCESTASCTPIEMFLGILMSLFGIVLLLPYHTFVNNGAYATMLSIANENIWGATCLIIGLFQILVALKTKNKLFKAIGLSLQTFLWSFVGTVFLINDLTISHTINTAFPTYLTLAGLALYTAYRLR